MYPSLRDLCVRLIHEWDHAPTSSDFMDFGGNGIIERIRAELSAEPLEPGNLKGIVEQAKSQAKRPPNGLAMQNASRILDALRDFPPDRIVPEAGGGVRLYWFSLGQVSIICDNDGEVSVSGRDN